MDSEISKQVDTGIIGKVYAHQHSFRNPDVVRVVGRTKVLYIVEHVPLLISDYACTIDVSKLKPITQPLKKGGVKARYQIDDGALLIKGNYYFEVDDLDRRWTWCEY